MTSSENRMSPPGKPDVPAKLQYRPDIDGMRAAAVIVVILFHAFPDICPGGFIGVDVFFALSGFLITGIILTGLSRGEFSFSGFYSRRIRRIFPALSLVLAFCLAVGWCILTPDEWHQFAKSVVGGAAFASNLLRPRFTGYFDPPVRSEPLLHLWSLGIEEQFYIVWPLVVVLLWKFAANRKRGAKLLAAILLIAGASFAFDIGMLHRDPSLTFFSPLTRMWELLAGAALAQFTMTQGEVKRRVPRELMSATGLVLIATGLVLMNERTLVPGWWSLLPVLGTVFLTMAGSEAWFNRRVLASRPFVGIGLISYPLYLWHWPLLVFMKLILESGYNLSRRRGFAVTAAVLVSAWILSWATYRFVETPMRFSSSLSSAFRVRLLATAMAGVAVVAAFGLWTLKPRLDTPSVRALELARADMTQTGDWKMEPLKTYTVPSLSSRSTLMVGDSFMEHYLPRAKAAIKADPDLASAVFATSGACPPLPGMNPADPGFQCPAFYEYWKTLAFESRFSTIAIAAHWEMYIPMPDSPIDTFHGHRAMASDYDEAWKGMATDLRLLREPANES